MISQWLFNHHLDCMLPELVGRITAAFMVLRSVLISAG